MVESHRRRAVLDVTVLLSYALYSRHGESPSHHSHGDTPTEKAQRGSMHDDASDTVQFHSLLINVVNGRCCFIQFTTVTM